MEKRLIGVALILSKYPDSTSSTIPSPLCRAEVRTVWTITAALKNVRYELVPVSLLEARNVGDSLERLGKEQEPYQRLD